jgi:hypothetical protein
MRVSKGTYFVVGYLGGRQPKTIRVGTVICGSRIGHGV